MLNVSNAYSSETIEINFMPNLSSELISDKEASNTLRKLAIEYAEIYKKQKIDKKFYLKVDSFIKENNKSLSALSALLMIFSMCNMENDDETYPQVGTKIINYITSTYPKTVQGKISLILLAQTQSEDGNDNEAFKILHDNYEVILSAEKDSYYKSYLYELNFENNDPIAAEYFFLLGNIYFHLNKDDNAIIEFNKIIDYFPNSSLSTASKRVINAINALNKSL